MIHTQISMFFHSSSCNFSASFFSSILEKIVNGPGRHKRHSTWTENRKLTSRLPARCSLTQQPEEETFPFTVFICSHLQCPAFHEGMSDYPGLLQPLQVGRVQMSSHLLQPSRRGLTQRMPQPFTSEFPRVYWRHPWLNRTKWKEARNCRNAGPLCRTCKC